MQFDLQRFDHDRLQALIRHPSLQSWLQVDTPAVLLINGTSYSLPQSETSFFTAKLVDSMHATAAANADIVVLAFFCGQHRDLRDVYSNPSELMMSLFLQLVDSCRMISPLELQACTAGLAPTEVGSICEAFERLVEALDESFRLFVVVDGLQFFAEPADRAEKTVEIVKRLRALCGRPLKATVKLLFASPSRSTFVEGLFDDGEFVTLPKHCRPGGAYAKENDPHSKLN
jgi:hypothetical protein